MRGLKFALCGLFILGCVFTMTGAKMRPQEEIPHPDLTSVEVEAEWTYWADIPLTYAEQEALHEAAEEFGVPYELAASVVWRETTFRNVYGDSGRAHGYMQIHPQWHYDRMAELGVTNLFDPESNFRVGCHYLSELLEKYGDTTKALMAYNMGEYGARKAWAAGVTDTKYSRTTIQFMNETFFNGDKEH